MDKASAVNAMIGNLSTSLSREKTQIQANKLLSFASQVPDLADVSKFLTCPDLDGYYTETVRQGHEGLVSTQRLNNCMLIVSGRLMLR